MPKHHVFVSNHDHPDQPDPKLVSSFNDDASALYLALTLCDIGIDAHVETSYSEEELRSPEMQNHIVAQIMGAYAGNCVIRETSYWGANRAALFYNFGFPEPLAILIRGTPDSWSWSLTRYGVQFVIENDVLKDDDLTRHLNNLLVPKPDDPMFRPLRDAGFKSTESNDQSIIFERWRGEYRKERITYFIREGEFRASAFHVDHGDEFYYNESLDFSDPTHALTWLNIDREQAG